MNVRRHRSHKHRRRGSALLEGIIALLLLSLGIAVVGGQINSGAKLIQETEGLSRSMMMARSKLAELELGLIQPEEEVEGNFGKVYPGHSWRLNILPTQTQDLYFVRIDILDGLLDAQSDDETEADYEAQEKSNKDFEPHVIYSAFTYRVPPAEINLTEDFGVTEDELAQLTTGGPDGEGVLPEGFDPTQPFTPQMLASLLDDETILKFLPALLALLGQSGGGQIPALANLPPELQQKLQELGNEAAGGSGDESGKDGDTGATEQTGKRGDTGGKAGDTAEPGGTGNEVGGTPPNSDRPPTMEDLQEMLRKRDQKRGNK